MMCPDGRRTYFLVPCHEGLCFSIWLLFPRSRYSRAVLSPPPNLFWLQCACRQFSCAGTSCLTSGSKGITIGLGF